MPVLKPIRSIPRALGVAVMVFVSACTSAKDQVAAARPAASAAGAVTSANMANMPGMDSSRMVERMAQHLLTMTAARGDALKAMVPTHRQMVANMLSQTNQEIRQMNMSADATWGALTDSVREDLIHLPDLSGAELERAVAAHGGRVTRLLEMHRAMMTSMKK